MTDSMPYLRTRLSFGMFLQYAAIGAWAPVLARHLQLTGLQPWEVGALMGTGPVATLATALLMGQIADRWMATERLLAVNLLASALFLGLAGAVHEARFARLWFLLFGANFFYGSTLSLSAALAFRHLKDAHAHFPVVRIFGTVGWMAGGWALGGWMLAGGRGIGDGLFVGAAFSVASGLYSLTLPHTPPARGAPGIAAGRALGMLRDPSFAVFTFLNFAYTVFAAQAYFRAAEFYSDLGVPDGAISTLLTLAQPMEIVMLLFLPRIYSRVGVKGCVGLGLSVWVLRYGIMAMGGPKGLVIAAQALHGICFTLTGIASQIYIERVCPKDVRASAQALHSISNSGLGMLAGAYLSGWLLERAAAGAARDWTLVWSVAGSGCLACLIALLAAFRPRDLTPPGPPPPSDGTDRK